MAGSDAQLGPSITNAVCFLRKIYQDISELLAALDGVMAERGWCPTEANRVSWALSNGSNSSRWVLNYLFRFYCQAGTLERFEHLIAFNILLDPPAPFDQPMMLGVVARFAAPTSYQAIVQQWRGSSRVFEALRVRPGPRMLSADEVSRFLPAASSVFGTVAPLCSLSATESLTTRFVDPLLTIEPTLGS
jgi:hypothetical protein